MNRSLRVPRPSRWAPHLPGALTRRLPAVRTGHLPAVAVLLATALSPAAPAASASLLAAASASAPRAPDPADEAPGEELYGKLAGSVAGVGRVRPGRPAAEPANPETMLASRPFPPARPRPVPATPPAPQPPRAQRPPTVPYPTLATEPNDRAADLAAQLLPLGTGFALMGLGLGYLGARLRKGL
ncbi:hypothetical protein [Streptomyces sp. NPDC007369]|uniref:hypothetical protein n=1 Tax=Streptomyces sp. NPDC007369 TaxID=3154589 RepID=UPI0033C70B3A